VNKSYFQIQYAYPKAYPGKANSSETPKTADQLSHFEWLQNLRRNPNKVVEKGVAVTPPQNNDASQFSETLSASPTLVLSHRNDSFPAKSISRVDFTFRVLRPDIE
jgi:hypothetical protein